MVYEIAPEQNRPLKRNEIVSDDISVVRRTEVSFPFIFFSSFSSDEANNLTHRERQECVPRALFLLPSANAYALFL